MRPLAFLALFAALSAAAHADDNRPTFDISSKYAHERLLSQKAEFVRCQGGEKRTICLYRMGKARIETASERADGLLFNASTACPLGKEGEDDCVAATAALSGILNSGFTLDQVLHALYMAYGETKVYFTSIEFNSHSSWLELRYPTAYSGGLKSMDVHFTFEKIHNGVRQDGTRVQ